eukprot:c48463_g1_i1 orf=278-457(+)
MQFCLYTTQFEFNQLIHKSPKPVISVVFLFSDMHAISIGSMLRTVHTCKLPGPSNIQKF